MSVGAFDELVESFMLDKRVRKAIKMDWEAFGRETRMERIENANRREMEEQGAAAETTRKVEQ